MKFYYKECIYIALLTLITFTVKVWSESSESNESSDGEKRERRGIFEYGLPPKSGFSSYGTTPPLSSIAPLSIFATKTNIMPAHLVFHKRLQGGGNQLVPLSHLQSILASNGLTFSPAVQEIISDSYLPVVQLQPTQDYYGSSYNHAINNCQVSRFPCSALASCAPFYEEVVKHNLNCEFHTNVQGACCRFPLSRTNFGGQNLQGPSSFGGQETQAPDLFSPLRIGVDIQSIGSYDILSAEKFAFEALAEQEKFEKELQNRGITVTNPQRPEYGHLQFFRTSPEAQAIARLAIVQNFAGSSLARRLQLNPAEASFGLQRVNAENTFRLQETCPTPPQCGKKEKFYRSPDGSCNNIFNPRWGQARTAFERITPPRYLDGISAPRRSVTGRELPSPRVVSVSNVPDIDRPSREFTLSVMQWGQFLDHDLTHAPIFRFGNSSGIECCDENGQFIDSQHLHPECFPIEIPPNDPFFSQFGRRCMNFVRSLPAPSSNCTLGFREQMNQVTHFLDGSAIYGSSVQDEKELRAFVGGLLRTQEGGSLLPIDRFISGEDCFLTESNLGCFAAGDSRVNEQPHLSIIHTIWVRQHNLIAKELSRSNPHWSDETTYQETRRIIVALMQHIVFNEWLPILIGTDRAEQCNLLPLREGFTDSYDKFLSPTIRNEFSSVGFRFGHTLVQGMLQLFDKIHANRDNLNLFEHFNRPRILYRRFDDLLRGLFMQPIQSFDNAIIDDLTNRLFQTDTMRFGMDLISLNIQRARDHATGTYNDLREACGLKRARTFYELRDFIRPESIQAFRGIYESVEDIDPFVAAISEAPVDGAVLGPLFSCLLKDQFTRVKFADRFYYENGGMPTSFTEAQLYEIRKISWARIICENSSVKKVQPLAFRLPGPHNEKVPCSSRAIPNLDLTAWISAPKQLYGPPPSS